MVQSNRIAQSLSLKFWVEGQPFYDGYALHIKGINAKCEEFIANNIVFIDYKEAIIPDPVLKFRRDEAQQLMDSLWQAGLRPTEGTGSAGALMAVQNHLKDMQKLNDMLLAMIEKNYG